MISSDNKTNKTNIQPNPKTSNIMQDENLPPFSARNNPQSKQLDNQFPETAKNGLAHLLFDLIDKNYVSGWPAVAKELQRIGRLPPEQFDPNKTADYQQAQNISIQIINELSWLKLYDFCERLHNHLAQEISFEGQWGTGISIAKSEAQKYISQELQRLFLEEDLAYEFTGGIVQRRGRKHTVGISAKAHLVLGDTRLSGARRHYEKALQFFRNTENPDFENCIKDAVCSVESAAKSLFPEAGASTLGEFSNWLSRQKEIEIPKAIPKIITGIYAIRSGTDGVGHGGGTGGKATKEVAEYILSICASQIIYLTDIAEKSHDDIPF